jgi:pyruvate/2-oxoglutarate dehydrogenase complex dihydrolipoamide acyltransferase (E2) component
VTLRVPQLGNGVDEATVLEWLIGVGETVEAGEPVVTVETDKATSDLEAPVRGTLVAVLAADGVTVNVGDSLGEFEAQ